MSASLVGCLALELIALIFRWVEEKCLHDRQNVAPLSSLLECAFRRIQSRRADSVDSQTEFAQLSALYSRTIRTICKIVSLYCVCLTLPAPSEIQTYRHACDRLGRCLVGRCFTGVNFLPENFWSLPMKPRLAFRAFANLQT